MKKLFLLSFLLLPYVVSAQTYQWTDSNGTVSFTEDLGKVPKKYRKKVRVIGDVDTSPQVSEVQDAAKPAAKVAERQDKKTLYGGKDEKGWRTEFAQTRGELKLAEQDLVTYRNRLQESSKMSRSEYLSIQNTVRHEEFRVLELRKRLEALTASADQAGVPMDFRQ